MAMRVTTLADQGSRQAANWFMGETWAADRTWLEAAAERVRSGAYGNTSPDGLPEPAGPYTRVNGAAVIEISGALVERPGFWARLFGAGLGYAAIRQAVQAADADPHVSEIVFRVDSPGGTVKGCLETAQAIATASKPTRAEVVQAASAAYWLASAADRIVAVETAVVGCLGVQLVVPSRSKAEELGPPYASPLVLIVSDETEGKNADPLGDGEGAGQYAQLVNDQWAIMRREIAAMRDLDRPGAQHRPGRGDESTLASDFAAGAVLLAPAALERGMIDEIRNLPTGGGASEDSTEAASDAGAVRNPTEGTHMDPKENQPGASGATGAETGGAHLDPVAAAQAQADAIIAKAKAEATRTREKAEAEAKVNAEKAYEDRREAAVARVLAEGKILPYQREAAVAAYDLEHRFADAVAQTGHKPWTDIVERKPDQRFTRQPEGSGAAGAQTDELDALAQFNAWAKANPAMAGGDLQVAIDAFEGKHGAQAATAVTGALFGDVFDALHGGAG